MFGRKKEKPVRRSKSLEALSAFAGDEDLVVSAEGWQGMTPTAIGVTPRRVIVRQDKGFDKPILSVPLAAIVGSGVEDKAVGSSAAVFFETSAGRQTYDLARADAFAIALAIDDARAATS